MYSRKRSSGDCVYKLCDIRVIKALMRMKKSFKSIDFDLAKHVLVFNINHRWILKIKMSLLGSKRSSNILIGKIVHTREETNTAEHQGTTHSR